jgi:heme exporter protein C
MTHMPSGGPPRGDAATPRSGPDLLVASGFLAVAAVYVRAILFTPSEALQGPAQKILYVHVPAAFVALYLAFALMAVCSALYLFLKDEKLDRLAESLAEVGLAYTTVVLITGPIWAKPIWGAWWTWDARLTSTLFLWFIILGYLLLRGAVEDRGMRARYSAVLGLLAALLIPFIHLSVYLFRTMHPEPIILKPSAPSMSPEMLRTFIASFLAFTLLFLGFVRARYRYATLRDTLQDREALR